MKNWRSITGEINGAAPRGFLRWTGPLDRRVRKFDGPSGRGLWIALMGNAYKVSVTGLTFLGHMA